MMVELAGWQRRPVGGADIHPLVAERAALLRVSRCPETGSGGRRACGRQSAMIDGHVRVANKDCTPGLRRSGKSVSQLHDEVAVQAVRSSQRSH